MRVGALNIVREALRLAVKDGSINAAELPDIVIEKPKKAEFGDYSTNIAMLLGPLEKRSPREVALVIAGKIETLENVAKCEVAGPGFINIFLEKAYWCSVLSEVLQRGADFGRIDAGAGKKVQVEFVSANPTGPLHIGHGRGAAVGDALANILSAAGYDVTKEYYWNDRGRQVLTLGESVRLRMEELAGKEVDFPENYYKGEYVREIAQAYKNMLDRGEGADPVPTAQDFACARMQERIRQDLKDFGVEFDHETSEKALDEKGLVMDAIKALKDGGFTYEEEGALWFRTMDFGDDKDRVLRKADGELTYLASDVAYHWQKVKQGYSTLVDIWGADHHGYEARIRAAIKTFGRDESMLKIVFIQLVALLRGGVPVAMGKREGEFVTLRQVMDEVGRDACRFFFLMRRSDAQLDFDLELAKSQAPENPVYYVQYCHARIHSIIDFAAEKGAHLPKEFGPEVLGRLELAEEIELISRLGSFEEVVEKSAMEMAPHRVTFYLMELAGMFHPYYSRNRVVTDDAGLTAARLLLCKAICTVIANGLALLGVSAPTKM